MSPAEYTAMVLAQTRDFNAGKQAGLMDGAHIGGDSCLVSFDGRSQAFEDGYYNGFRVARERLLAGRQYEEIA